MSSGDSHVQPHSTISASQCSQGKPHRCGFLRKRGKKERVLENLRLSRHFNWRQKFIVVREGCCYCFDDEISKSPSHAISLQSYYRVFRSNAERAAYVFTIEPSEGKLHCFAASSEDDRMKWMRAFRKAMEEANPGSDTLSLDGDYQQAEEEIYTEMEKPLFIPNSGSISDNNNTGSISYRKQPSKDENENNEVEDSDGGDDSDYDRPNESWKTSTSPTPTNTHRGDLPPTPVSEVPAMREGRQPMPLPTEAVQRRHNTPPSPDGHSHTKTIERRVRPVPVLPELPGLPRVPDLPQLPDLPVSPSDRAVKPTHKVPVLPVQTVPVLPAKPRAKSTPTPAPKPRTRRLSEQDCLFDNDDRDAAIRIIRDKQTPGTCLLRNSRNSDSRVLVVMTEEGVREYKIFSESGQVTLNKKILFQDVDELLHFYSSHPLPNRSQTLSKSYSTNVP